MVTSNGTPSGSLRRGATSVATAQGLVCDAVCPACERFIGPVDVCPFCDAGSTRRPEFRLLCRAVPPLAVLLLLLLYLGSVRGEPPLVPIDRIRPTMNFAVIRIRGTVSRKPRVLRWRGSESLMLQVDDSTGALRVILDAPVSARVLHERRAPGRGDVVDVAGTLQCDTSRAPLLRVHSARQVRAVSSDAGPASSTGSGSVSRKGASP